MVCITGAAGAKVHEFMASGHRTPAEVADPLYRCWARLLWGASVGRASVGHSWCPAARGVARSLERLAIALGRIVCDRIGPNRVLAHWAELCKCGNCQSVLTKPR